jgi:exodeoxyribonuclease VII small subunit
VRPEPVVHGERRVYSVSAFNRGVASWLQRLPTVWVEGEITELRRRDRWGSVFFTLKDPADGSCLPVSIPRGTFDALRLDVADGASVHVFGRPELFARRGTFRLRALSLEPVGLGALLAQIERLKAKLAAEGLFARSRPLPVFPRRIGLLTGAEAAARGDFVTAVQTRFPAARIVVLETAVQGPAAPRSLVAGLRALAAAEDVDVVVLARGGGSFEDLLPFSDEAVVRAVAACPVPVVSAVGHEQDTPLCDLAADARASTPTRRRAPRASACRPRPRVAPHARARPGADRGRRRPPRPRPSAPRRAQACTRRGARRPASRALPAGDARPRLRDRAGRRRGRPRRPRRRAGRPRGRPARRRRVRRDRRGDPVSAAEPKEPTFEEARAELEKIVAELESGRAGLEEALALWNRGEELYRLCVAKLDAAQGAVEELARRAEQAHER